ncbi:MAG: hypothetical protein M3R02_14240, partial [Chloroflexota bacterium]|nr:hypothetical protein [Chloroflexota bacterium]
MKTGCLTAYSATAHDRRRCTATRTDGTPCKAYAAWGDPGQRCGGRGGRSTGRPSCRCAAYQWPHRPGGGLCRWPDEPEHCRTTPAGTHGEYRNLRRRFPWLDQLQRRDR